ncbi:hypothetical protein BDV96DRAFT_650750 [Lophiotrema nucula]|uniref:Heterokaryon incompatibility domain-containing protein n=1 Tax=Lophiotrema nucula TaxID=690887 RepID=A0A6A5YTW6_9PLEO|nr:hypothetical protein BDV96DRAFT_650750 [Lophiotrema nucula]
MRVLIDNCLRDHPLCKAAAKQRQYPKRLIDVGGLENYDSVRIVASTEAQETKAGYLALSHCWGDVPPDAPWKLTSSRLLSYSTSISLHLLPRTFYEAVRITRKLGERFLWIDSLCIIQDSVEDWISEAKNMGYVLLITDTSFPQIPRPSVLTYIDFMFPSIGDVYAGSLCTLSAASDNANGGLVLPREDYPDPSGLELHWKLSTEKPRRVVFYPRSPDSALLGSSPVYQRAWCLQERELSLRLVQFTTHDFHWVCLDGRISEGDLYRDRLDISQAINRTHNLQENDPFGQPYQLSQGLPASRTEDQHYNYWYRTMEIFSASKISDASNRHAALQGLLNRQIQRLPDTFTAGLWRGDILRGLLWMANADEPAEAITEPPVAPSWSWMSLEAPIRYQLAMGIPSSHTKETDDECLPNISITEPVASHSADPYFGHRRSVLDVKGTLVDLICPQSRAGFNEAPLYHPDEYAERKWRGEVQFDTTQNATACKRIAAMPLTLALVTRSQEPIYHGLALVPSGREDLDTEAPVYRRVGYISDLDGTLFKNAEPINFSII